MTGISDRTGADLLPGALGTVLLLAAMVSLIMMAHTARAHAAAASRSPEPARTSALPCCVRIGVALPQLA